MSKERYLASKHMALTKPKSVVPQASARNYFSPGVDQEEIPRQKQMRSLDSKELEKKLQPEFETANPVKTIPTFESTK